MRSATTVLARRSAAPLLPPPPSPFHSLPLPAAAVASVPPAAGSVRRLSTRSPPPSSSYPPQTPAAQSAQPARPRRPIPLIKIVGKQEQTAQTSAAAATAAAASPAAAAPPSIPAFTSPTRPAPLLLYPRSSSSPSSASAPSSLRLSSLSQLSQLDPGTFAAGRPFELTVLGSASGRPTLARNTSSLALRIGSPLHLMLVDCGEGTLHQLLRTPLRLPTLSAIFITHMHGDHVFGLSNVIAAASGSSKSHQAGPLPNPFEEHPTSTSSSSGSSSSSSPLPVLHIFGPPGLARFVKFNLKATHTWLGRRILFHELLKNNSSLTPEPDVIYHQSPDVTQLSFQMSAAAADNSAMHSHEGGGRGREQKGGKRELKWACGDARSHEDAHVRVYAAPLKHRDLSCWGYVFEEVAHPGQPRARKVAVLGDTSDSSGLQDVASGADLMVHEATFLQPLQSRAWLTGHSTAGMAGAFARSCEADHLLLTHFSHRYLSDEKLSGVASDAGVQPHLEEARAQVGHDRVHAAQDLQVVYVAMPKEIMPLPSATRANENGGADASTRTASPRSNPARTRR